MNTYTICFAVILEIAIVCSHNRLFAETESVHGVEGYSYSAWFKSLPKVVYNDYKEFYDIAIKEENRRYFWAITISSVIGIYFDQDILDESKRLARRWGLTDNDNTEEKFSIFGFPARFPTDLESSMYFIGDGWLHGMIGLGHLAIGEVTGSQHAIGTGLSIMEGLLSTGIATQILKHLTGRESPVTTTVRGGVWRFFPDQKKYHEDVPKHDAFPSGHVATSTMTISVLAERYPDNQFIWPVGIGLTTLLGFEMMNNGVHWFGDYPLAIGLGYLFGKIAAHRHAASNHIRLNARNKQSDLSFLDHVRIYPFFSKRGQSGVTIAADIP